MENFPNGQIAYKVVRKVTDTVYKSVVVRGKAQLAYVIGEEVIIPKWLTDTNLYPLLFMERTLARMFQSNTFGYSAILKCECTDLVNIEFFANTRDLEYGIVSMAYNKYEFPVGTISYKRVIPIMEIV